MRFVSLDTETTGLEPRLGHRIVEIGLVEVCDRSATGRSWHHYLNPERDIPAESSAIHGITQDKVKDAPLFADVFDSMMDFIGDSTVVIHNAPFDLGFLDAECLRLKVEPPQNFSSRLSKVVDTLDMAKKMFPGSRKSLDALCDRFEISRKARVYHGALLDAQLLADVYLNMTRGQSNLMIDSQSQAKQQGALTHARIQTVRYASEQELSWHHAYFS